MNAPRLLTLIPTLLFAALALGQADEVVDDFRKYFKKYEDTATRVEAVLALEGVESPRVVEVLLPVLKLREQEVVHAAVRVLGGFETVPPAAAVIEQLGRVKDERVRIGLLRAITAGRYPGGDEALAELLGEKSWSVRRSAVQAVASLGETSADGGAGAIEAIAPLAIDREPAVRAAALEGLAQLASPRAVELAIAALGDDVWQVRATAVSVLGRVRSAGSIPPLIARMQLEEGRLVADIGAALGNITGRNFGARVELWVRFWKSYQGRFEIPSDAQLAELRRLQAERAEQYDSSEGTIYHGVDTPSRAIVFVVDVSGSMDNLVTEVDRFEGGNYPSMRRMDIVKTELARTIAALEPHVKFNVLAFATEVKTWKKKLTRANVLNRSNASDWIQRLEAIGGQSTEDLVRAGFGGTGDLAAGKTNTHAALMRALGVPPPGKKDDPYDVELDTIFFLSDGRPSSGAFVDTEDILREVRRANELRRVVIHTIAIGEFQKTFMQRMAAENGGVFVDLGR